MRSRWTWLGAALVGAGLLTVPVGTASAAAFPLSSFDDVVADAAHGHVFVSPGYFYGSGSDEIIVTDLSGKQVAAITGLSKPSGMALSPDGTILYAALAGANKVVGIDTATLQQTSVAYPLPAGDSPWELAVESGKLWVSYYNNGSQAAIGDIDLSAASPAFTPNALPGSYYYAPKLAVDPLGQGTLVAEYTGISVDFLGVYDVATTPPTTYLASQSLASCPANSDVAVLPGGSEFVVAGCSDPTVGDPPIPPGLQVISTTTLGKVATWYGSQGTPASVSVAPSGLVAVGSGIGNGPDVYVFKQGASTPQNAYTLQVQSPPGSGQYFWLAPQGLAFAPDGSVLAGVTEEVGATNAFVVHGLHNPGVTASSLSLGGTSSAVLGKTVTLTGKLGYTVGAPSAKSAITITRTLANGSSVKKVTVATAANGTFTLTDTPAALGAYTYAASYAGDSQHQPAAATRVVNILRYPVTLTLGVNSSTVNYRARVTVSAHLGPTYTGRTVSVYAQAAGSSARQLLKAGRVSSTGNLSVSYVPSYTTTFSVVFPGDAKYAPKTVTRLVRVRASVGQSFSGYYASTSYGGTPYRVFRHTALLKDAVTVAPNKAGDCVRLEIQQYSQGTWYSGGTSGCGYLSAASKVTWSVSLSQAAGGRYRIRADLFPKATDTRNLANDGSWFYFSVVT